MKRLAFALLVLAVAVGGCASTSRTETTPSATVTTTTPSATVTTTTTAPAPTAYGCAQSGVSNGWTPGYAGPVGSIYNHPEKGPCR